MEHSRGASALPMTQNPIFSKLYSMLPRSVMRLLESQWHRKLRQKLVRVDDDALQLQGSTLENFGNPPRVRTITLDARGGTLVCSCGHYKRSLRTQLRWMLPCGHLLWAYSEVFGPEAAYPIQSIHYRWLRLFCEEPSRCPPRMSFDGPRGIELSQAQLAKWFAFLEARLTTEDPEPLDVPDYRDVRSLSPSPLRMTNEVRRSRSVAPLIDLLHQLNKTDYGNQLILETVGNALKEVEIGIRDYYQSSKDPNPNPLLVRDGRQSEKRADPKQTKQSRDLKRISNIQIPGFRH